MLIDVSSLDKTESLSFVEKQINIYTRSVIKNRNKGLAMQLVFNFEEHYNHLAKVGGPRKTSYLASTQSALSKFKSYLIELGAPDEVINNIRLSKSKTTLLNQQRSERAQAKAIDLKDIDAYSMISDARKQLTSPNKYLRLIALAALTGRRTSELLLTINFGKPRDKHKNTHEKYWTYATGFCKQKRTDKDPLIGREIPLLFQRDVLNRIMMQLRKELPANSTHEVNSKYGKQISRNMKRCCSDIGGIHEFRKFYAYCTFKYFNNRNCSIARVASEYLGHKKVSSSILTYLSFKVSHTKLHDFTK
jgi:integrase